MAKMDRWQLVGALGLVLSVLAGCEKGPAEKAGEKVDKAADKAGKAIKDAVK